MEERVPIIFETTHTCSFFDLDPYGHMSTDRYLKYFLQHRMDCIRDNLGVKLSDIESYPFAFVTKNVEIKFIKPVYGDKNFTIKSYIKELKANTCIVELTMASKNGKPHAKCFLTLVNISKTNLMPIAWDEDFIQKFYKA